MSRRVFDVGLDRMGLRHGLKANKDGKRSKSFRSTRNPDGKDVNADDEHFRNDDLAVVPHLAQKKSNPNMHPQSDHNRQLSEPIVLPPPDDHVNFPLPPDHPSTPSNTYGERSLHSSQLYSNQDSPSNRQKPEATRHDSHKSDNQNYDLRPPPPNTKVKNIDTLSERLLSGDHLRVILKDPSFFLRFTAFLNRYQPQSATVLVRYLEAKKAIKAVEYANALAETIKPAPGESSPSSAAASIDPRFQASLQKSFDTLVSDALPAYITSTLTKVVTEYMVREITGQGMPVMRELVGGLAEVFCLADPSVKDCPIVYASEEFYRTTRYSRDDVLGRNCRFLQGPKTDRTTIARLGTAVKSGQESCETVLNYRRDGSPFMNLLLTAPLYDNRGNVRYYIGAQVDVSGLVEDGRGLESFASYLQTSSGHRNKDSDNSSDTYTQKHLRALDEFGQMLSVDESQVFQRHSRNPSSVGDAASSLNYPQSSRPTPSRKDQGPRQPRRVLGNDEDEQTGDPSGQMQLNSGLSTGGKLPGVYQNYLLVRPYPSLRIIFVSPALRIPGLLQTPFLSRIGGPAHVREGLEDAFEQGVAVTAKITWAPRGNNDENISENGGPNSSDSRPGSRKGSAAGNSAQAEPKTRYISCTPLLGSDDQVGVWMVVMVENETITGSLASRERTLSRYNHGDVPIPPTPSEYEREDDTSMGRTTSTYSRSGVRRDHKGGSEGGRLYADFMRSTAAGGGPHASNGSNAPPDGKMGEGGSAGPARMNGFGGGGSSGGNGNSETTPPSHLNFNGGEPGGMRIEELVSPVEEKPSIL